MSISGPESLCLGASSKRTGRADPGGLAIRPRTNGTDGAEIEVGGCPGVYGVLGVWGVFMTLPPQREQLPEGSTPVEDSELDEPIVLLLLRPLRRGR